MIEQEIQNLTTAIRDLIAVLQTRPTAAEPVALSPVAQAPEPEPAPDEVAPTSAPAALVSQEPKRRGRPPKTPPPAPIEPEAEESEVQEAADVEPETSAVEVVEEIVTVDTVRAAIRDVIVAGGKDREDVTRKHIIRILAQYNNAKTLPELPPEVYPKVLAAIRAIPV